MENGTLKKSSGAKKAKDKVFSRVFFLLLEEVQNGHNFIPDISYLNLNSPGKPKYADCTNTNEREVSQNHSS